MKNFPADNLIFLATADTALTNGSSALSAPFNAMEMKTGDLYVYRKYSRASANVATVAVIIERSFHKVTDSVYWSEVYSTVIAGTTDAVSWNNNIGPFAPWVRAKVRASFTDPSSGDNVRVIVGITGYNT